MAEKTIIFLRHSRLILPYKDHSEMPFSVLSALGLNKLNPPVDISYAKECIATLEKDIDFAKVQAVYSSPSIRCIETSNLLIEEISKKFGTIPKFDLIEDLLEVYFDLAKLDSILDVSSRIKKEGIAGVNSAVFEGMVRGEFCEPVKEAYERVSRLFEKIKHLIEDGGMYIFLTHDYLMRVIELYIRRKGELYWEITKDDLEHTARNLYLKGYTTTGELSPPRLIR